MKTFLTLILLLQSISFANIINTYKPISSSGFIRSSAISADGNTAFIGYSENVAKHISLKTNEELLVLSNQPSEVTFGGWSPDSSKIVIKTQREIRIYESSSGELFDIINQDDAFLTFVPIVWSSDSKKIAFILHDISNYFKKNLLISNIGIYSLEEKDITSIINIDKEETSYSRLKFHFNSTDDLLLVSNLQDRFATIWDIETGELVKDFARPTQYDPAQDAIWSPDDKFIVQYSLDFVKIFEVGSDENAIYSIPAPSNGLEHIEWIDGGTKLLIGGVSKAVIWDFKQDLILQEFDIENASFVASSWAKSPDEKMVAVCTRFNSSLIYIWDSESGELLREFSGHDSDPVNLTWSQDNSKILSHSFSEAIAWSINDPSTVKLSNEILAFPNPSNDIFHINIENPLSLANLYNSDGSLIKLFELNGKSKLALNLSTYPTGYYYLDIISELESQSIKLFKK